MNVKVFIEYYEDFVTISTNQINVKELSVLIIHSISYIHRSFIYLLNYQLSIVVLCWSFVNSDRVFLF